LAGRRSRTLLLIGAVALATALVAAISCALASLNKGMMYRVASSVGNADVNVRHVAGDRLDAGVVATLRGQKDIALAAPHIREGVRFWPVEGFEGGEPVVASVQGIDPAVEYEVIPFTPDVGRRVENDWEVVLDRSTIETLGAELGSELVAGDRLEEADDIFTVVGIVEPREIEILRRPQAWTTIASLREATGVDGFVHEVLVQLKDGVAAEAMIDPLTAALPPNTLVRSTELTTSGIGKTIRANNFMFTLSSVLTYIASGFIVLTGLTTNLLERQRELAVLRCIGASRAQLAGSQFVVGGVIGAGGAAIGLPLGIFFAWMVTVLFPDRLPAGLVVPVGGMALAAAGAVFSGLVGASWAAWSASRAKPLAAMASRSKPATTRGLGLAAVLGLVGVAVQLLIVGLATDGQVLFWGYAAAGLPMMFVGYFLLGAPLAMVLARTVGPVLGRVMGLPKGLLRRSLEATPFRTGFTAGALMVGLALMTSIWTNGSAIIDQWIGAIRFPDAFVNGQLVGITDEHRAALEGLDFVDNTCAVTIFRVDGNNAFGLTGFRQLSTSFIAFEVEPFFEMTKLHWVAGDPETAIPKLEEGSGLLVAQEFLVQREGFGIGDTFPIEFRGRTREFEIVGAVSSPGLDIVNKYFDFEEEYANASIHAVFGSRQVLEEFFRTDKIDLLQVGIADDSTITDEDATAQMEEALATPGLIVGSGRQIQQEIIRIGLGSMRIATYVAIGSMLIGCFGVANIVVAGIDARRFEFGVLRSIGASRGVLARLLIAEVLMVALTACILGTLLGIQGSWAGLRMNELLAGLKLDLRPPAGPIALGWAMLVVLTVGSVLPIVLRVSALRARDLLQSTRG